MAAPQADSDVSSARWAELADWRRRISELYARVRALTRRPATPRPGVLTCGDLQLERATHTVTRADREIDLSPREFALLEFLLLHCEEVVTRTQIMDHVWDFDYDGTSNVIDVYVRYLREKVDRPFGLESIETVRGVGYRLNACSAHVS